MNRFIPCSRNELSLSQRQGRIDRQVTEQHPGRVYFDATYWPARLSPTATLHDLQPGDPVEIVGRDGLTLLVKPLSQRRKIIMRHQRPNNWLMMLAVRTVQYFLLGVAGCTISYMGSVVLEIGFITEVIIIILNQVLARALILVLCLLAITVITESLRY